MKTILLLAALFFSTKYINSQTTFVPDNNFEAYLEANGMGNGVANDDLVTTANISGVTTLVLVHENISDLTGISGFISLINFTCTYNNITTLDLSANTALVNLYCNDNYYLTSINLSQNVNLKNIGLSYAASLTSLNIDNNTALETLGLRNVPIVSLNLTQNTALKELVCPSSKLAAINVSQNLALLGLDVRSNKLTTLDLSNNTNLQYLLCSGNLLESLNIKNGNNTMVTNQNFFATNNPNLTCINVDNVSYSTSNWLNIDSQSFFSTNCSLNDEDHEIININVFPNPTKNNLHLNLISNGIYCLKNIHGQTINEGKLVRGINILNISEVEPGLYFLIIKSNEGKATKKIIKP